MKIGLVYDLRSEYLEMGFSEEETAEFDSEETIEFLSSTLQTLGHEVLRIGNIYELARRLSLGERWDLVFNLTEGIYGRSREAQVPALLEAFNIPYTFSDPLTLALSLDKAMAKSIIRDAGLPTSPFVVLNSPSELDACEVDLVSMGFPLFVKPVSEGTGKGISVSSITKDIKELRNQCRKVLAKYNQPVIVEKYLPGREFTVGILGTGMKAKAIGVLEVELLKNAEPLVYSYLNKELCESRVKYSLASGRKKKEASDLGLAAYKALGCRDAGRVDFKLDDDGKLFFLEMNPLAGLHPTHSDLPILASKTGMEYKELISGIIESALERRDGFNPQKRAVNPSSK